MFIQFSGSAFSPRNLQIWIDRFDLRENGHRQPLRPHRRQGIIAKMARFIENVSMNLQTLRFIVFTKKNICM